jgi:creatinine amidohydrolase
LARANKKRLAGPRFREQAQELTWYEFKLRLDTSAVVFLPVGACEQHGPALPLRTDVYIPLGICDRLARQVGGVVMPPIAYGYKSQPHTGGGQNFSGTTSLCGITLINLVRDVLEELLRHSAKRICLYNGHIENACS